MKAGTGGRQRRSRKEGRQAGTKQGGNRQAHDCHTLASILLMCQGISSSSEKQGQHLDTHCAFTRGRGVAGTQAQNKQQRVLWNMRN